MASTKEYLQFVLEQLSGLEGVTYRAMMGEFLLYYNGVLFGGIYDDRLLVKIVPTNKEHGLQENIPYDGAKPMYLVDRVDDIETLKEIVLATYNGLPKKK